jgi:hypothetical protein
LAGAEKPVLEKNSRNRREKSRVGDGAHGHHGVARAQVSSAGLQQRAVCDGLRGLLTYVATPAQGDVTARGACGASSAVVSLIALGVVAD